jgi:beta-lactamase regulating signal transducer with metallopeptidase domain
MTALNPGLLILGWSLLHFLWQGAVVWALTALALHLARRQDPRIRYMIGCLALLACVLLPLATCLHLASPSPSPERIVHTPLDALAQKERFAAQLRMVGPALPNLGTAVSFDRIKTGLERGLPFLLLLWSLGCAGKVLRLLGGWVWLCNLRRAASALPEEMEIRVTRIARRMGLLRAVALGTAPGIHSPMVLGWVRPLLLVPASFVTGLDPCGLEALLVHELAHIRRNDYLVNLLQCVVEVVLFYHPAVGWISRRVRVEREMCCDDAALAWCDDPLVYAETLARLDEIRAEALEPALAAAGAPLFHRIKRILLLSGAAPPEASWQRLPRSMAMALASLTVLLFSLGVTAVSARAAASQVMPETPRGWIMSGTHPQDYVTGIAPGAGPDGATACWLSSQIAREKGFGTLMQPMDPAAYRGKRIRLSAWLKAEEVETSAQLWMRVDTPAQRGVAFDNMTGRHLSGTSGWTRAVVVLDVDPNASNLSFGVILAGRGRVWISGTKFEAVGPEVASTDMTRPVSASGLGAPQNWERMGDAADDYAVALDPTHLREGAIPVLFSSKGPSTHGFGALAQGVPATNFLSRRVRFTAWVRTEGVPQSASLWFRADDAMNHTVAFDNMDDRPLTGATPWTRLEIVQDIPSHASLVIAGLLLVGPGRVWIQGPALEVVGPGTPLTGTRNVTPSREPANLDFSH